MNAIRSVAELVALVAMASNLLVDCAQPSDFRAGAATVDITPTNFPAIVAGGFLEAQSNQVRDRLFARAIVLDDGVTKIAMVVVDTCMMTQDLIDDAKMQASQRCAIAVDHMMVSATHTHSAPAAMACLGTRADKSYAAYLPGRIAEVIVAANDKLQPARIGWASINDWEHTHNRRWIRNHEKMIVDPFGNPTGRAHMHPGYQSPDVIGPSGPVDPALSVVSLKTVGGQPLAVLANYSQHYFGTAAISSDYYGLFCKHVAALLGEPGDGNGPFVVALSQGTSGDQMWMDYGSAKKTVTMDRYAEEVARYAEQALAEVEYHSSAPLGIVERTIDLEYRVPDEKRLEWAHSVAKKMEGEIPKNIPEVYAQEALILHQRQKTQVKLQAIRIGELTIAALPNEVYALTGLKLRGRSPFQSHINIELANGAEGYIPTPEQHALGGYTTWPARTAGLEVHAETKIVDALIGALEEVTGKKRREMSDVHGHYAKAILAANPLGYWRLNDEDGRLARNSVPNGKPATLSDGFAWYLPGVGSGTGIGSQEELVANRFSGNHQINRSIHLAGGQINADTDPVGSQYSIACWFWLGVRSGAGQRTGTLFKGPSGEKLVVHQDSQHQARLALGDSVSTTELQADQWNLAVLVRDGTEIRIYANQNSQPVLTARFPAQLKTNTNSAHLEFGSGLQGKLDEIAVFPRTLDSKEIAAFYLLSGVADEPLASTSESVPQPKESPSSKEKGVAEAMLLPASQPLSAEESLRKIHVPRGYRVELVAAEPHVVDPVAFDWDAKGRLWVVEMSDYPLGMDGQGQAGGRVRVLEDLDRDGYFETSRIFADGLSFPNGILTWRDGALVTAAPKLLFLRDIDGDGLGESQEILFEGFNQGNQQLRMNHLRWGLDGWVYCANGGHHANHGLGTRVVSKRNGLSYEIGSRDFRIRPDTGELALESGPSQYGRNRDAWGHWFGTQNANPLWQYVLSDRYLARNPFVPAVSPIQHIVGPGSPIVFPASPREKRFHSFEQSGRFTSACSGLIYGDKLLFGGGAASHAFTCEPFHNLVQHNLLIDSGVSFKSVRPVGEGSFDFFASEDRWCRPVMVRTGPDGALWIADMYRYMIEHPDWLPPEGKAELLPHYRLGDDRGRIFKISLSGDDSARDWSMDTLDTRGLVAALDSANDWRRDKAHQLLHWNRDPRAIPMLVDFYRRCPRPESRVQILSVLGSLGALSADLLVEALRDPHPRVRECAMRLSETQETDEVVQAALSSIDEADAKLGLQLALTLGQWKSEKAGRGLVDLAKKWSHEPMIVAAIMSSSLAHAQTFSVGMLDRAPEVLDTFREPMLRQSVGTNDVVTIASLLKRVLSEGQRSWDALSAFLLDTQRAGLELRQPNLRKLAKTDSTGQLREQFLELEKRLALANQLVDDSELDEKQRIAAAQLLTRVPEYRLKGVDRLSAWLRPQIAPELQANIILLLAQSAAESVPARLADAWPEFSPELRTRALDVWLSREGWTNDLLDRIEQGSLARRSLDLTQRARLLRHPSKSVAQRAARILDTPGDSTRKEVLAKYRMALELSGDSAKGLQVYARACASCHRRGDSGFDVGPNLATVINHTGEKLLGNILDPNADIQPGYQAYTALLADGEILSGLLSSETANSIIIKQAGNVTRTVSRQEIARLQSTNVSFMPEGLETALTVQDMADLLSFLHQPFP